MWWMQEVTLTTNHSLPALVVPPAKCLFDQRQQNLAAAAAARGQEFRPETGLALGHIVLAGCLRYRALMTKHLPEVQFMAVDRSDQSQPSVWSGCLEDLHAAHYGPWCRCDALSDDYVARSTEALSVVSESLGGGPVTILQDNRL